MRKPILILEKGRKPLPEGTVRDFNGLKYKKVGKKWEYVGKTGTSITEKKTGKKVYRDRESIPEPKTVEEIPAYVDDWWELSPMARVTYKTKEEAIKQVTQAFLSTKEKEKKASPEEIVQAASNLGKKRFEAGRSSASAQDPAFMKLMQGKPRDVILKMLDAYNRAWHTANVAAPVGGEKKEVHKEKYLYTAKDYMKSPKKVLIDAENNVVSVDGKKIDPTPVEDYGDYYLSDKPVSDPIDKWGDLADRKGGEAPKKEEPKGLKISSKDPATMTASQVNAELDKLDAESSKANDELIEAGFGHTKHNELSGVDHPAAKKELVITARQNQLQNEIQQRMGPGFHRMGAGFKVRKKAEKSIEEPSIKLYKTKVLLPSEILMKGREEPGKRDGTGPHKDSAQASISDKGKRKQAGEKCPHDEEEDDDSKEKDAKKKKNETSSV